MPPLFTELMLCAYDFESCWFEMLVVWLNCQQKTNTFIPLQSGLKFQIFHLHNNNVLVQLIFLNYLIKYVLHHKSASKTLPCMSTKIDRNVNCSVIIFWYFDGIFPPKKLPPKLFGSCLPITLDYHPSLFNLLYSESNFPLHCQWSIAMHSLLRKLSFARQIVLTKYI